MFNNPTVLQILACFLLLGAACSNNEDLKNYTYPDLRYSMTVAAADRRPYPVSTSPFSRLRSEGIRAVCNGDPEKMASAGFNLALPWERLLKDSKKTTPPDSSIILTSEDFSDSVIENLRRWALNCKKNNIIMMYMLYAGAEETVRHLSGDIMVNMNDINPEKSVWPHHQYRHIMDWHGNAAKYAPCPLERRYWNGFIRPQLELVARVLIETGAVGGGALELETYCFVSIYPGYASQKKSFCYCDYCFNNFVQSIEENETSERVPPALRFDWLTQRGLLPDYEKYLENSMAELIKEMMQNVRKINPEFIFGFYPYAPFWYYDALIRGSGTPELPCLVFPSSEYRGGYMAGSPTTYFGDASTPAGVSHLRRNNLKAMYAGGLYDKAIRSPYAVAAAMDRMLRGPDGYWIYREFSKEDFEPFWKVFPIINQWTTNNPGPLRIGELCQNTMVTAIEYNTQNKPEGVVESEGRIIALYDGDADEVHITGGNFESENDVAVSWQGRGSLPLPDESVSHSGQRSILFEPSAPGEEPRSPYIDQKIPKAEKKQSYEMSFWIKTADASDHIRFWVGQADSRKPGPNFDFFHLIKHPAYLWYNNFVLQPDQEWIRLRVPVSYNGLPPLIVRFWCPPTDGKLWLDDIRMLPVQTRTIGIPLNPPNNADGWGIVDWKLSPPDARCNAQIVDAKDNHVLRTRLYPKDSLEPLSAITGLKPVMLYLTVYPSKAEPVILEEVQICYTTKSR